MSAHATSLARPSALARLCPISPQPTIPTVRSMSPVFTPTEAAHHTSPRSLFTPHCIPAPAVLARLLAAGPACLGPWSVLTPWFHRRLGVGEMPLGRAV